MFDATNSTRDRRKMIEEIVVKQKKFKLFFVESICDDPNIIEQNIMVIYVSVFICLICNVLVIFTDKVGVISYLSFTADFFPI